MIHLPVRFGDKIKSKGLEVDFLTVDVPVAYNVIAGWPTLHRVKTGLVASSPAASPSVEAGINSASSGSRPARTHPQSEDRPRNIGLLQTRWRGSARPYRGARGCQSGLADRLTPWLGPHQLRPSPADAAALSSQSHKPPGLPVRRWYRVTSPSSRQHSATAFIPRAKTSTIASSSSVTFGGSEGPVATESQDLTMSRTRESLTPESPLMKLADSRRASGGATGRWSHDSCSF
ncbi:hypothetical protein Cgig2_015420 [Carnegiea gigantea]|uniref:Uncharacterized protein n=1 Tax=Carnegiea gigantea TaxID=171969 RepID=A0A9Q1JGN3_9CARY|nr:hypothetical protein Cgig2_015420 [Carnegiea gigantea]